MMIQAKLFLSFYFFFGFFSFVLFFLPFFFNYCLHLDLLQNTNGAGST